MSNNRFKSVKGLGFITIYFYIAVLVATVVAIVAAYFEIDIVTRIIGGEFVSETEIFDVNNTYVTSGYVALAVSSISLIFFLIWVYRTRKNLYYLQAEEVRFKPGWSVGYFFIPILNLFRPYQVVNETWKASNPNVDYQSLSSWKELSSSKLVGCWWGFTISSFIGGLIVGIMILPIEATLSGILNAVYARLVNAALNIGIAIATIFVVKTITRFQDEKFNLTSGYCPRCGQKLEESMLYCPNCGSEVGP